MSNNTLTLTYDQLMALAQCLGVSEAIVERAGGNVDGLTVEAIVALRKSVESQIEDDEVEQ
jgi:hypothetical protein